MQRITDMTSGNITRQILRFAFPLIIANIGQQLYMIVDASIVGLGVGVKALAAVGSTDWSYWLILWTVMALTQGFATFVSRYFGKQDFENLRKSIAMSVILCLIIGASLTVVGFFAARPVLELLKTPSDIIDSAETYLLTMISGTLIVASYNMSASILRAFGDGRSPLIAMIIAAILNIALDLTFVLLFDMGIFGAALASVIAQFVSFLYCFHQIKKIEYAKLTREDFRIDAKMIKELLVFGIPLALEHIVIALGGIVLQSTINAQGSIFVAGYTATNKLYGLLECTAIALGMAFSTFSSQNFGAGNKKRVIEGIRKGTALTVGIATAIALFFISLGKYMLRLFIDTKETGANEALKIAYDYLLIMTFFLIVLYLIHVYRNVMQAMGISVWSMVSGFSEFVVRVCMAKLIIPIIGSNGIFYTEPLAWIAALLFIFIPFLYYKKKLLLRI
ncbi:MAG: MATE family efflux transporter [Ruminococcaceae bacterium]|nr:MATE family efflux transporter [Oscillospiraceae bacterium]